MAHADDPDVRCMRVLAQGLSMLPRNHVWDLQEQARARGAAQADYTLQFRDAEDAAHVVAAMESRATSQLHLFIPEHACQAVKQRLTPGAPPEYTDIIGGIRNHAGVTIVIQFGNVMQACRYAVVRDVGPADPATRAVRNADMKQGARDLKAAMRQVCDACAASAPQMACSVCGMARYCGRECQRTAWRAHKVRCGGLARVRAVSELDDAWDFFLNVDYLDARESIQYT